MCPDNLAHRDGGSLSRFVPSNRKKVFLYEKGSIDPVILDVEGFRDEN